VTTSGKGYAGEWEGRPCESEGFSPTLTCARLSARRHGGHQERPNRMEGLKGALVAVLYNLFR